MKKKFNWWPKYQIDSELVDLLAETRLMTLGITDAKSYFNVWSVRIIVWVIVCAVIGAVMGGLDGVLWGMLWGVLAGMVMPLLMVYLAIIAPMMLAQLAGYLLGIAWVLFVIWLLIPQFFRW